ncbi:MAG: phosphatidylserine/phosphatidylglycerophosphate/cardiolipin synthase family protein [Deltaproteobacteria bacterium]|nr:phosphatidylserine/phosphatidylglycerophosphate/cardiolipin synthase family protein [Deltaproteobacteria bacterium]
MIFFRKKWFVSLLVLVSHNSHAQTSDGRKIYLQQKMEYLEKQIRKFEDAYSKLGDRETLKGHKAYKVRFKSSGSDSPQVLQGELHYSINKFMLAENCFVSAANEVYDEHETLVKVEEGPIDLRKTTTVKRSPFVEGQSLAWQLELGRADGHLPELYFKDEKERDQAFLLLNRLIPLCHQRYSAFRELEKEEEVAIEVLRVPEASKPGGRLVRYYDDDPTMKAALLDGNQSLAMRLRTSEDTSKPGDSILIQSLSFAGDEAGLRLADTLIRKAQDGVRVEVVIDALTPFADIREGARRENTKKMYGNLMAAGIPVHGYRCESHHLLEQWHQGQNIDKNLLDQRPHEKLWIVNGQKAVLGGMNIGNEYFRVNRPGFHYWRDQDIIVEGKEIVQDLVNVFESNVASYNANFLNPRKDSCFNPYDPIKQAIEYQKFFLAHFEQYKIRRIRESKQDFTAYARAAIQQIERDLRDQAEHLTPEFYPLHSARIVHNRPKLGELHIEDAYLNLINNATSEILIENAYFIPSEPVMKSLRRAAKRGVEVKIITNAFETNDVPPVALLSRHRFKEFADYTYQRAGQKKQTKQIEIYEWTGDIDQDGILEQGTNHSKFMLVDRKLALIGSYNLDPRSRNINSESGIVFEGLDTSLANQMVEEFYNVDLKFARRVSYREMVAYRKPVDVLQALLLKIEGYQMEKSVGQLGKESFFYRISLYDENTW